MRPFVLHAHFYQPERLNPWTGALDPEPSAAPHRDWNERIHGECYRPNAVARIFDSQRRVEAIVNNYEGLSFNFGPTLLSWLETAHPRTYAKILDGDWRSGTRIGHGNALAQAYNHMILPLAHPRDVATQIRWGQADFRHRFNRMPAGMWLPEAATNPQVMDALIDSGIGFTVLAPHQAARVRAHHGPGRDGEGAPWQDVPAEGIDTGRAYRRLHSDGSGRSMAVFFYDGALAQAVAFDAATSDAGVLLDRIEAAGRGHDGLVSAAMDGETFGHHHPFGELGLAYALSVEAPRRGLRPTNYAQYLAEHPPTADVEVVGGEGTSWSCAHGVGRWYRDCGCHTDGLPDWNQAWRGPLRVALDVVRDRAAEVFADRGAELLRDPWAARDDYLAVRLGDLSRQDFLERHALRTIDDGSTVDLWSLLESQRQAMVMYTSCGWFFSDVAGIETRYVLRAAARVMGLLEGVGAPVPRHEVLELLGEARSNRPEMGTGADIWRHDVEAAAVTPTRVAAHRALEALVLGARDRGQCAEFLVDLPEHRAQTRGRLRMSTSRVQLRSQVTGRTFDFAVVALHLGGLDFHGVVAPFPGRRAFDRAAQRLWEAYPQEPMARLIQLIGEVLPEGDAPGHLFDLEATLPEGRQQIVGAVFSDLAGRFQEAYARLYHDHRRILETLTAAGYELPRDLRAAAELTLAAELDAQLERASDGHADLASFQAVRDTVSHARSQGYQLDLEAVEQRLTNAVTGAAETAARSLVQTDVDAVQRWLVLCAELGVDVDLSAAQEHAFDAAQRALARRAGPDDMAPVAALGSRLGLSPVAWGAR